MVNYQNGQIYKIWDVSYTKCYIGSTVEELSKRFGRHKVKYEAYLSGNCPFIYSFLLFDEFGVDNCKIEWVENYPCNSKKELEAREGTIQRETECVNKNIAGRNSQEYYRDKCEELKQKQKRYAEENPVKIKEKGIRYFKQNKDKLLEKHKCVCGATFTYCHKSRHLKTNKHQQYLQNQNNPQE